MRAQGDPEVSILVVNWNSAGHVRKCLQSVFQQTRALRLEIVVVDSGSYDGCGEMLSREFPAVKFIQSRENVGFARANNLGAGAARAARLLLLNPDTELKEDSIGLMVRRLETLPGAGALGCRLVNGDGSLQTSCVQAFPTVWNQLLDCEFLRRRFPGWSLWGTAPLHGTQPARAEVVSGACILVKREVFEQIGGFSECYFMYGEDLDLCFKIKQAGHGVYHTPETAIIHYGGGSTRQSASDFASVMTRESVYRFLRRHRGPASAMGYRLAMAGASVARMVLLLPMLLVARQSRRCTWEKWLAILRWSLGFKRMTAHAPGEGKSCAA